MVSDNFREYQQWQSIPLMRIADTLYHSTVHYSITQILMVRWAPVNLPISRRLQTLSIIIWIFLMPFLVFSFMFTFFSLKTLPFALVYVVFIIMDVSAETGGRKVEWMRRLEFWRWMKEYFPMKLIKTSDLDPSKNYIFGYHPHGKHCMRSIMNRNNWLGCIYKLWNRGFRFLSVISKYWTSGAHTGN